MLSRLPVGEIAAPIDIAPELLLDTRHTVIATCHHRGQAGIRTTIELFSASPDAARAMLAERGSTYLALCPDLMEAEIYVGRNPQGLAAQLRAGHIPSWLEPVQTGVRGFMFWKIRQP